MNQAMQTPLLNSDWVIPAEEYPQCYDIIKARDTRYAGSFFVAVRTTGVFCRPGCPARLPLYRNCDFYRTAEAALNASFRPCRRCKPLSHLEQASDIVQTLVAAVEERPEHRWTDADFDALSMHASTARRHFKKRFGMTFVQYARARRMGLAMHDIRQGNSVTVAQLDSGYDSGSGFRDAFSRIMGDAPVRAGQTAILKAHWLDTPLGPMLAIADDSCLYLLEFVNRRALEREVERLRKRLKAAVVPGSNAILDQISTEITAYFDGSLTRFKTPIRWFGSEFQQQLWSALIDIPYGSTTSYGALAKQIGRPDAVRAVGSANGHNQFSIIVPCHRVIAADGSLTGYGGGLDRKAWLIRHENATLGAQGRVQDSDANS